jgi:hypothetical protein
MEYAWGKKYPPVLYCGVKIYEREHFMKTGNNIKYLATFIIFVINLTAFSFPTSIVKQPKVIIIQDERPQVEVLADFLRQKGNANVSIVKQQEMPEDLSAYNAVIAYIHKDLDEKVEQAIIEYTRNGGRFIALHHTISSRKTKNKYFFDFLGIHLDNVEVSRNPVEPGGGYGWVHPIPLILINLNPIHFIVNQEIKWDTSIVYKSSDEPGIEKEYPAMIIEDSEVYLNHKFTDGREKVVLLGVKFYDKRNGTLFMQDRGAWIKTSGKGQIVYFQPGHSAAEFQNLNFSQMILNAILWKP